MRPEGSPLDPRRCPTCGTRGIVPVDQPGHSLWSIDDPVMLCTVCQTGFRAQGMRFVAGRPPTPGGDDRELDAWIERFVDALRISARRPQSAE